MPMVYIPDTAQGPGCYPGYPGFIPQDPESVRLAKAIIKANKADKKKKEEEDKKKELKNKPASFTLLETWGILMFGSIPVVLGQLALLGYVQRLLDTALHAPH